MHDQQAVDPKKVGPIQMGEFLRKYVSRRLCAVSEEIAALKTAMRQLGVGSQGAAEAHAIFHQLIYEEWASGFLNEPQARIKVDEKKLLLPKHTEAAGRKHRNVSHVELEGLAPIRKDSGAEQGDVDGPLQLNYGNGGG